MGGESTAPKADDKAMMGTPAAQSARASSDDSSAGAAPSPTEQPKKPCFLSTLTDDVDPEYTDIPVIACCLASGLCDSVAFSASNVFVSMQTGNTIFLALGTAHLPHGSPTLWLKALVSIAAFWAGCFCFGQTRRVGNRRKLTLALSFLVQSLLILVSAAASQAGAAPAFALRRLGSGAAQALLARYETDAMTMLPLSLMAFQFGGQIVTSRVMGFNEVPTNVLTSLYCDLLSDPLLFAPLGANVKRTRRVSAVVLMIVGAIIGAWLQKSDAGMPAALWIAGFVKMVIAVAWLAWKPKAKPTDEKGRV